MLWQRGVFSVCRKRAGAAARMRLFLPQEPPTFRVSFDVLFRSKQEDDERERIALKPESERSDGSWQGSENKILQFLNIVFMSSILGKV